MVLVNSNLERVLNSILIIDIQLKKLGDEIRFLKSVFKDEIYKFSLDSSAKELEKML